MNAVTLFIKNTAYQSFNQIIVRIISAVSGIIVIRFLSKSDFGLLALVLAITGFTNLISNLGYPTMIIKSISQYYKTDPAKAASYYRFNFKVYGLITLVFSIILFFSAPLIASGYGLPEAANYIRLSAVLYMLMAIFSFYEWTFTGLNEFKTFSLKVNLPKEILTLAAVLFFLYLGLRVSAPIFAQSIGIFVFLFIALVLVSKRLKGGRSEIDRRWIVKSALEVTPANLAYASTVYMDIIIIGALLGTQMLASYRVCLALIMIIVGVFPIGTFVMPTFSVMKRDEANILLNDLLKFAAIVSFPVMFFISSFSRTILTILFGAKYSESGFLLSLFIFVLLGRFFTSIFVGAISYMERFKALSVIWVILAVANIVLLLVLTDSMGLMGAACATMALYYLLSIFMGVDISRNGMRIYLKPILIICLISTTMVVNIFIINDLTMWVRLPVYLVTLLAYILLLKVSQIFAGMKSLKNINFSSKRDIINE